MPLANPVMPRSTAYLAAKYADEHNARREELAAHERLTAQAARLEAVRQFVASHSPGEDAWIDDSIEPPVVRWTGLVHTATGELEPGTCAASNFREAREELGY